ncbi:MAG: uracil phosphoribosyltransferase [Chitinophagales bacterium]
MVHNLSENNPLVGQFLSEIRHTEIQQDRLRFRKNLERLGNILAYEISKTFPTKKLEVSTELGIADCNVLAQQPILATILRAGLPLHNGMLQYFDKADNAFISAYRKHHKSGKFTIKLEALSCPDLDNRTLILCDPMLATGASMMVALEQLLEQGTPKMIHIATVIACSVGIGKIKAQFPNVHIWTAAIDEELTAKGYIVPGLGDAGDLAFGEKIQD